MKTLQALVLITCLLNVQTSFAQFGKDTTVTYYNNNWKVVKKEWAEFIGVTWPENGKFRRQDFYAFNAALQMDGTYADKKCTIEDGVFTWFDQHGMMTDSCLFISGKKHGTEIEWNDEGGVFAVRHWNAGLPADTALGLRKNGKLRFIQVTDSLGNGSYRQTLEDGKTVQVEGLLLGGKRIGKWVFRDSNGILGVEAIYANDSIQTLKCFDENGQPQTSGNCMLEEPAGFKGGPEGWRRFLEKNLQYPEIAQEHNIQGVVRMQFIINKDGSVDELKVLDSPHESLTEEAKRIMLKSGKWVPARQFNRTVIYRHIQSITFRLM